MRDRRNKVADAVIEVDEQPRFLSPVDVVPEPAPFQSPQHHKWSSARAQLTTTHIHFTAYDTPPYRYSESIVLYFRQNIGPFILLYYGG